MILNAGSLHLGYRARSAAGWWRDDSPGANRCARVGLRHGGGISSDGTCELDAGEGSKGFAANCQLGGIWLLHLKHNNAGFMHCNPYLSELSLITD
jgi:hypothetical protein